MLYFTTYPTVAPTVGRHAGPEGLRGGGVRRHRLHPRRGDRARFSSASARTIVKGLPFGVVPPPSSDAFTFALLIIILVFKPTGLFGEKATDKV